jgi:hypothetical protein
VWAWCSTTCCTSRWLTPGCIGHQALVDANPTISGSRSASLPIAGTPCGQPS